MLLAVATSREVSRWVMAGSGFSSATLTTVNWLAEDLRAIAVVDQQTSNIMSVRFIGG
jgi:hypothetical protein